MTIGMVEVACFAATAAGPPWVTITSTLSRTSSAARPGEPLHRALRKARLVRDVPALHVAEPSQRLAERAGRRTVGRPTSPRKVTDAKHLLGRLRGGRDGSGEHAERYGHDDRGPQ